MEKDKEQGGFAHIHLHDQYSLLDGINNTDSLPEYVKSIGQTSCAQTNHGNVAGTYAFNKACIKAGIQPLLGMEAYFSVIDHTAKEKDEDGEKYYHLILLAQNNTGLKNLFKLSTLAYTEGMFHKPRLSDGLLAENNEGLLCTSACLGSRTSQLILKGRVDEAEKLLDHHAQIFKDRFFIEVQLHADREQQLVNQQLVRISKEKNLPLVLTNDCFPTGTLVQTVDGVKKIEDLEVGDLVLTHKGNYEPVEFSNTKEHTGNLHCLSIAYTKKQIRCTPEHPIYAYRDSSFQWIEAKNVKTTDYLCIPIKQNSTVSLLSEKFPVVIDETLAWWLGLYCAEGSVTKVSENSYNISFALAKHEKHLVDKVVSIAKEYLGINFRIQEYHNWYQVRGYNTELGKCLSSLFNKGSRNKHVPRVIMYGNSKNKEAFLNGLFEGDGDHQKTAQLATASINLAYGVKQLLASLGVWANVSFVRQKCQTGTFDQYRISWTQGCSGHGAKIIENYLLRKVTSNHIESYTGKIHNLQVHRDNSFVTEAIVHNCHYTHEEDKLLHEQALCMQTNNVMTSEKRFSFGTIDVHVASHDWMWSRAKALGIPYEAISNTLYVASLVNSKDYFSDTWNRYPKYQKLPEGVTSWEALANLSKSMLAEKFGGEVPQEYKERMNKELKVIKRMGFSDYLLIVQDFINQARSADVLCGPGRGSAAGSCVAYALGITQIDPIKYGLLFERFLNPGRSATPLIFTPEMLAN